MWSRGMGERSCEAPGLLPRSLPLPRMSSIDGACADRSQHAFVPKLTACALGCAAAVEGHSCKRLKPTDTMATLTAPLLVKRCNIAHRLPAITEHSQGH